MRKSFILFFICLLYGSVSYSQYADKGSGKFKNDIWWIDWQGFNVQNGAQRTITTHSGLTLKITFSKVNGVIPQPNIMNTWLGANLYMLYDFSNPAIRPALLTVMTPNKSEFTLEVVGTRNGVQVPFSFIIADAEATAEKEQTYIKTSAGNFQTIEFFRNSSQTDNPIVGCGTKSIVITKTFDENALPSYQGQNAILKTEVTNNPLVLDVIFDKQPPHGGSALAFGVLEPIDRGDLPSSYGFAHHQIKYAEKNSCNFNEPFPELGQIENLFLGHVPPDADSKESNDDNTFGVDEEAISAFPEYDGSGIYSLHIPLKNVTGQNGFLSGWFDYNQDGQFQDNERVVVTIPSGSNDAILTWNNVPKDLADRSIKEFAFRFRISTSHDGVITSSGRAPDGEVEDYYISLPIKVSDSLVINDYAAVTDGNACTNELHLDDAQAFNAGDTVMLMQMKGALIDSSNTTAFGQITAYAEAGNYEMHTIQSKSGNIVKLQHTLVRNYDFKNGKVQLIRVPYFADIEVDKVLTAAPWDGLKGGVLVINASGTITMNADIDVSGKGFRHGEALSSSLITTNETGYYYNAASNNGGQKGEGIADILMNKQYGRGAYANGGGGGNAHNAGGGGGGNGGAGGQGGDQYETLKTITEKIGGKGGRALTYSAAANKLFMGGAGGMGHANNFAEFPAGNGGGIVIVMAANLISHSFAIRANGDDATEPPTPTDSKDGMPGGGAGGSILLQITNPIVNINLEAKGGKGADYTSTVYNGKTGPGGGGGGGVLAFSQAVKPAAYITDLSGGMNGTDTGYGNDPWDAAPGQDGKIVAAMNIPIAATPFKPNIDSVRISEKDINCLYAAFDGISTTQHAPITTWSWDFGDNHFQNGQSTEHNYVSAGTYPVKLTVEDANGCRDSILKDMRLVSIQLNKSPDQETCLNTPIKLFASGGSSYNWFPADDLNDPTIAEPTATPASTTKYFVTVSEGESCFRKDSILITVNPLPDITTNADTSVCGLMPVPLMANGGDTYAWSPGHSLDNPSSAHPIATPPVTTTYHVKVVDSHGCANEDSVQVFVFDKAPIQINADTSICKNGTIDLLASGGDQYAWYPAQMVESPAGASTAIKPLNADATFYVDIRDHHDCHYKDSVQIKILPEAQFFVSADTAVCRNETLQLTAGGGDAYHWFSSGPGSFPDDASINIAPENTSVYSVVISEKACGKRETLTTTVRVHPTPTLLVQKSNDISCKQSTTRLQASGTGQTYVWSPASSLDNPLKANPNASPKETTTYFVTTKDQNGCTATDSLSVEVNMTDKAFLALPNAFTPNSDGLNDCFGIPASWGLVRDLQLRVYNRYGQLVFQSDDPAKCWDGTFKGEPQNTGVFAYTISATTACEVIKFKGSVTLIR